MPEKQKRVRKTKPVPISHLAEVIPDTNSMVTLSYSRGETRSFDYNSSRFDVGLSVTCHITNLQITGKLLAEEVERTLLQRMSGPKETSKKECEGGCNQKMGKQEKVTLEKMGITELELEPTQPKLPLGDLSVPDPPTTTPLELIPDEL